MHQDRTPRRRFDLFRGRLLRAAGFGAVTLGLGTACTSTVVVMGEGDGGAGGTTSSASSGTTTSGTSVSSSGVGGAPTTSSSVGPTTTGVGGTTNVTEVCFPALPSGCPDLANAGPEYGYCTPDFSEYILEWVSGPYESELGCCYEVVVDGPCGVGRPLMVGDSARTAPVVAGDAWSHRNVGGTVSAALDEAQRAELAEHWRRDGLFEHASVASFARFALELMALGAPPELVEGAHRAALDEVAHAKLCFQLASRFAGRDEDPGALEGLRDVTVRADLVQLAVATFHEGCVGETIAALVAGEQRERAVDPEVAQALAQIAEDEARHAELAWATVAWALRVGGEAVHDALAAALVDLPSHLPAMQAPDHEGLVGFGRLSRREVAALERRAVADVILPCARALLSATAPVETRIYVGA
ncbi:MAG: ferritin-like domain-containing protein [Myxococcales bacterium]|nr:ferritin-like domain-containing protein [Myxococcales bacterium]